MKISAVIAAAGMSSRMGDFKPLLPVGHVPLIKHCIDTLHAAGVSGIYVVTGHNADMLRPVIIQSGCVEIFNARYQELPMFESVRLGLTRARYECDAAFFTPADVALFSAFSIREMTSLMKTCDAKLVFPCYRSVSGHPVLLSRDCISHVLRHSGENGLRGAFNTYTNAIRIELPDPGLIMDADTPDDYKVLLNYFSNIGIPEYEHCLTLLKWFETPPETILHCKTVSKTALDIANDLINNGISLNTRLIQAGALLHDIAKGQRRHAEAGGKMLIEAGYPLIAEIVKNHMELPVGTESQINELIVVYYADKIVSGTSHVTVDERFSPAFERWKDDKSAYDAVLRRYKTTKEIEQMIKNKTVC